MKAAVVLQDWEYSTVPVPQYLLLPFYVSLTTEWAILKTKTGLRTFFVIDSNTLLI